MASRTDADRALAAGDFHAALAALRVPLSYPQGLGAWRELSTRFAEVCGGIIGGELREKALAVADERDAGHVQALYDLGFDLVEHDLPEVAATFLARACELAPGHPELLAELCAALERSHMHGEAVRWLEGSPAALRDSYLLRYLLAWNAAMTGDLDRVRAQLATLGRPSVDSERAMQHRIAGVLTRADTIAGVSRLDGRDLRGWHFAINGAVLLHVSSQQLASMRGRYAATVDSEARCHEALVRLRHVLISLDVQITTVLTLADPDSLALGVAAAAFFGVPARPFAAARESPGLIVAYDLAHVSEHARADLQVHRPGQILWGHASEWTRERPIAADIVTYLYETNTSPWGERTDTGAHGTRRVARDDTPPERIAARLLATKIEPHALADLDALDALARAIEKLAGDYAAGAFHSYGPRRTQCAGSPVKSDR